MIIAIKDKKQESVDIKFNHVEYKDFLTMCDMCRENDLIMIIYSFETEE